MPFSLGHGDDIVLCRNTQGILSSLKIIRIYYSRIVHYGLKDTPRVLFVFCFPYQLLTFFCYSLLISEELSGMNYQLFSIFTCSSTKSNFNLKCNHERDSQLMEKMKIRTKIADSGHLSILLFELASLPEHGLIWKRCYKNQSVICTSVSGGRTIRGKNEGR